MYNVYGINSTLFKTLYISSKAEAFEDLYFLSLYKTPQ